jgi:hypothetical protein
VVGAAVGRAGVTSILVFLTGEATGFGLAGVFGSSFAGGVESDLAGVLGMGGMGGAGLSSATDCESCEDWWSS